MESDLTPNKVRGGSQLMPMYWRDQNGRWGRVLWAHGYLKMHSFFKG